MEQNKAQGSIGVVVVASLAAVFLAVLGFWAYKALNVAHLSKSIRSDLPILDLRLQFVDIKGDPVTPTSSRLLGGGLKGKEIAPLPIPEACRELVGGDGSGGGHSSEGTKQMDSACPKIATWKVKRHPIGFSLTIRDARQVMALLNDNTHVRAFLGSKFFQGLFHDILHDARIRAEDLRLEGFEGAFLERFLGEALSADAELHYDVAHGKKGFVFSFVREKSLFISRALPVVARVLARSGYRVPAMEEPILEMRIGLQRLFLTQFEDRVYLANGLEALLNVMESLPPPDPNLPRTPLVLTTRAEAFVENLLPTVVGASTWNLNLGLGLSPEAPGMLQFAPGNLTRPLCPKVFKGVLAGIPYDAFAAAVTSYYLPPDMTDEQWRQLATQGPDVQAVQGPEEGGLAVVWDLSSQGSWITQMGVVIAKQTTPDETKAFKKYFWNSELTAECGGGTVFLAATSQALLTRMRESCEDQSPSILRWESGKRTREVEAAQLFLFMNPGTGMRELLLAGGGASLESESGIDPQWKQEYKKAKEAVRKDSEEVFRALPIFAFAGNAAPAAQSVQLKELTFQQGAPR